MPTDALPPLPPFAAHRRRSGRQRFEELSELDGACASHPEDGTLRRW